MFGAKDNYQYTVCRQKPTWIIKKQLLNMSRVEIYLVQMNDGEYDSRLLIWNSRHGNTVGGKSWGMSCRGHVQDNLICFCIHEK